MATVGAAAPMIGICVPVIIVAAGRGIRQREYSRHLLLEMQLSILVMPLKLAVVVSIVASFASIEAVATISSIVVVDVISLASSTASP